MFDKLPAASLPLIRKAARALIRLRIWIPLRTILNLLHWTARYYYAEDETKQKHIISKINRKFKDHNIQVEVEDGIVTLNGSADCWQQVVELGHLAGKGFHFPKGVVNRIKSPDEYNWPDQRSLGKQEIIDSVDVVIVGAGISGCAIARELSKYNISIAVVERASDVSTGQTKANNGMIHPAINPSYGSLMHKLNLRGNRLYPSVCEELGVSFKRCGMLAVVTNPEEEPLLELSYIKGKLNGEKGLSILSSEELKHLEPEIGTDTYGALHCSNNAVIRPYEMTLAYAENAAQNGARFYFDHEVVDIETNNNAVTGVVTPQGTIACRLCINAAGVYAARVAELAGSQEFTIHPRPGQLLVFDKETDGFMNNVAGELTIKKNGDSKGGGVMLSVDGNILFGPTAMECSDPEDKAVYADHIDSAMEKYGRLVPGFPKQSLIASFAGVRAATYTEDFIIRPATKVKQLIQVAGIQSPGLASAPAIAEFVEGLVKDQLHGLEQKPDYNPIRKPRIEFSSLSEDDKETLIASNRGYAHVICRCEEVTEEEVRQACRGPLGARTVDGVKRRTRAGMGRCQGGFCAPVVAKIIAEERGVPLETVTKCGPGSEMFVGLTKEEQVS